MIFQRGETIVIALKSCSMYAPAGLPTVSSCMPLLLQWPLLWPWGLSAIVPSFSEEVLTSAFSLHLQRLCPLSKDCWPWGLSAIVTSFSEEIVTSAFSLHLQRLYPLSKDYWPWGLSAIVLSFSEEILTSAFSLHLQRLCPLSKDCWLWGCLPTLLRSVRASHLLHLRPLLVTGSCLIWSKR